MCQVRLQVKYSLSGLDLRRTQPSHSWLFAARGAKPVEGDGEYPPTVPWRKNMQRRRKHPSALRTVKSMPRFRCSRGADAYALLNSATAHSSKPTYRRQVSITFTVFPPSVK